MLLGLLAGLALFFMMMLTVIDVVGRKFFSSQLHGGLELTELGMLVLIFGAMPLASLAGEHVVFDLIDPWLPAGIRRWQHALAHLISMGLLTVAAWFVWLKAGHAWEMGDITAQLMIPIAPFHYGVAGMLMVTAACHLWLAMTAWRTRDEVHSGAFSGVTQPADRPIAK